MDFYKPMEPILYHEIPDGKDFVYQIKWDGIRILTYLKKEYIHLYTKKGNKKTSQYPEIHKLLDLDVDSIILDGEAICIQDNRPSFYQVASRNRMSRYEAIKRSMKKNPVYYFIFDILHLNGKSLCQKTLEKRVEILNSIITPSKHIKLVDSYIDGSDLYKTVKEDALEGVISKRITSTYISGKDHNDWYKYKLSRKILCIICGLNIGKEKQIKSLILAIKKEGGLEHIGSVSSGLTQKDLNLLRDFKGLLKIGDNPFTDEISEEEDIVWFDPIMTCWVSFLEWTEDGTLRHPKLIGFSDKKGDEANGTEYIK